MVQIAPTHSTEVAWEEGWGRLRDGDSTVVIRGGKTGTKYDKSLHHYVIFRKSQFMSTDIS